MFMTRDYVTTALGHLSLMMALGAAWPMPAWANPEDGVVSAGAAIITSTGKNLDVHQSSDRVIIDWRSFDIEVDEHTRFYQPSSGSVALNRVNSADPSHILGRLSANGNIILINPNGILIGRDAVIDVNGLVGSTANIDNQHFMAGSLHFDQAGKPEAAIINEGRITAKEAGLVGLVAPHVSNSGVIDAKLGRVQLAGGDTATIDLYGDGLMEIAVSDDVTSQIVSNTGTISAAGGTIAITASAGRDIVNNLVIVKGELNAPSVSQRNGKIIISAEGSNAVKGNVTAHKNIKTGESTVLIGGTLDVSGRQAGERGGDVQISGDNIALLNGTGIDASGYEGASGTTAGLAKSAVRAGSAGGNIRIGGDYLGLGDMATAKNLYVDAGVLVLNDALHEGDAGRTIFWSDNATEFYGNVYARALGGKTVDLVSWNAGRGGNTGDGGFVETSGHQSLTAGGYVDLTSSNGARGTYFLDPNNITIYGDVEADFVSSATSIDLASKLILWLDASDASTLFADTAGITPASNGTNVALWKDKSSAHHDAVQADNNQRPTLNYGAQNGLPLVMFDNAERMDFTPFSGHQTAFFTYSDISTGQWTTPLGSTFNGYGSYHGHDSDGGLFNATYTDPNTLNGGNYINGVDIGTGMTAPRPDQISIQAHVAVNPLTQNISQLGSDSCCYPRSINGGMAEMILYSDDLSSVERNLIEQYQSAKWGIALTPPGSGGSEAAKAMASTARGDATDGFSVFTTRYLERLSQSADVSLQAGTDITFDLKGDTLTLQADRNLTLTAGHDIKGVVGSNGEIVTSRTSSGGNITMTAGGEINLSQLVLKSGNGTIDLNATGNVVLSTVDSGTGNFNANGHDIVVKAGGQASPAVAWRTGTTQITAANDIIFDMGGDTFVGAAGKNLTFSAGHSISNLSQGSIATTQNAGTGGHLSLNAQGSGAVLLGGDFALNGGHELVIETAGGNITLGRALTLSGNSRFDAGVGTLSFGDTIDGAYNLTANAGTFSFAQDLGGATPLGAVSLISAASLNLPSIAASSIFAQTTGASSDIIIPALKTLSASSGGTNVTLVAKRNFINHAGSGAVTTDTGRSLIYTNSHTGSVLGGLNYDFRRFSCTYGAACPALGSGNGMLHTNTPVVNITPDSAMIYTGDALPVFTSVRSNYLNSDQADDVVTGNAVYASSYIIGDPAGSYDITGNIGTLASAMGYSFSFVPLTNGLTVSDLPVVVTPDPEPMPFVVPNTVLQILQATQSFAMNKQQGALPVPHAQVLLKVADTYQFYNPQGYVSFMNGLLLVDPVLADSLEF